MVLFFILIVLLGIISYRLWLLSRKESVDTSLMEQDKPPVDPMKPYLKYWYSFDLSGIDFRNNNKIYNKANQLWDAQIKNNTSITDDAYGSEQVITLDNTRRQYIQLPNLDLDISNGLTIVSVFKPISGGWTRLFDFGNGSGNNNIGFSAQNGAFVFQGNSGDVPGIGKISLDRLNEWVHFVWTLKPNANDPTKGEWKFYQNGRLIDTMNGMNRKYPNRILRTKNYIGQSNWSNDGTSNMRIDEFRIYNAALNDDYVGQLFHDFQSKRSEL